MKKCTFAFTTIALLLLLSLSGTVLGGGKAGKKHFKEGSKYESAQQWDLAAQQFELALANEPDNAEYRLHLIRARQMAALMFIAQGDSLEVKGDYANAYSAYAQAYLYDKTSETARTKMERMLEQQRAKLSLSERASNLSPQRPATNEIRVQSPPAQRDLLQHIQFNEGANLKQVIKTLARQLNLNVVFDESFKDDNKFSLTLNDVTTAKALDVVLLQSKHIFELIDRRTIMIYADNQQNRQRLEKLLVKTFYLSNADPNEARAIVVANLSPQRQVSLSKQLNALVVRATPAELEITRAVLDSLDKNRAEVILDVNIYEVSNSTSQAIGHQIAASDPDKKGLVTLGDLGGLVGGLGRTSVSALSGNLFGIGAGIGTMIGLPSSSVSLLQAKGKSRLLASTQIHALDGEQNQTVVGQSVPVKIGATFFGTGNNNNNNNNNNGAAGGVDSIQYRDVGLVIDVTPIITNEGYVQIKMKLESSSVQDTASDSRLTPTFTKRSLATISRVPDGVTAVVASVRQDNQNDKREGLPIIGLMPVLGRFFMTPKQSSAQSDVVITVTPRIQRTPKITPEDHLARFAGSQTGGAIPSIEAVLSQAQTEEDEMRRVIAQQSAPQHLPQVTEPLPNTTVVPAKDAEASGSKPLLVPTPAVQPAGQPVSPTPVSTGKGNKP